MEVRISYEIVSGPGGHLIGGDFRVALTAEENNLISLPYFPYIGNIHSSQIHADPAYYRSPDTSDEHCCPIRKSSAVTVSVAYWKRGDQALSLRHKRASVADAGVYGQPLQLENARRPAKDGSESDLFCHDPAKDKCRRGSIPGGPW